MHEFERVCTSLHAVIAKLTGVNGHQQILITCLKLHLTTIVSVANHQSHTEESLLKSNTCCFPVKQLRHYCWSHPSALNNAADSGPWQRQGRSLMIRARQRRPINPNHHNKTKNSDGDIGDIGDGWTTHTSPRRSSTLRSMSFHIERGTYFIVCFHSSVTQVLVIIR